MSRAAFARHAGVTAMAISKAARRGLKDACVGDRIDAAHPAALAYVEQRQAKKPPPKAVSTPDGVVVEASDLANYGELTIRELVERHGTRRELLDWVDALKKIEDTRKAYLANSQTEGELISRELVATHVLGLLEALTRRLLVDLPRTLVSRLYAAARSSEPPETAEGLVREMLSGQIKPAVTAVGRSLKRAT